MGDVTWPLEPYRIKVVEPLRPVPRRERETLLRQSGFNVFNIPADKVFIDLLTDSGTSAMSDSQWSGIMIGDESYAGSRSFFVLEKAVKNIFGFDHVIPVHQGRAAERILFGTIVKKGDFVPNNIHFDTTKANIEFLGAKAVNLVGKEAYRPDTHEPFKGNMDVDLLKKFIEAKGTRRIPLVMMTVTNNSGGGQPVSLRNLKEVSRVCERYGIPLFLDACRYAENSFFIKTRESGYEKKSLLEIAQEMFSYADGATMSGKKDALANIGGFLTLDDDRLAEKLRDLLIITEGFTTYGALAGRDLEAMARGLEEALDESYLEHRTSQTAFLGELLDRAGIPVFKPFGGHAVYVLADRFLPHIPRHRYPGWALTVALYREFGVRAVEVGGVMFGEKAGKGKKERFPELELVRLAIPRRVYTASHLKYVADALIDLHKNRGKINGLKIVRESSFLRHFTIEFEEI